MDFDSLNGDLAGMSPRPPVKVSVRMVREAIEECLMRRFTRDDLHEVLPDELDLPLPPEPMTEYGSKRELIDAFIADLGLPGLAELSDRIIELTGPDPTLEDLVTRHRQSTGGVEGAVKNLIFAADGPKPELVLRDALNNQIEITANADRCLVYDRPVSADGLTFSTMVSWWRDRERLSAGLDDREAGRLLHTRLVASLQGNPVERQVYDAYNRRYLDIGFDIPALIPQVYLHYDPKTTRQRGAVGSPLPRQRMDFLLLLSQRRRIVLEVDGAQHYATDDRADTAKYAHMVAADRELRLAGYEVYRFGGRELDNTDKSKAMLARFFDELTGSR